MRIDDLTRETFDDSITLCIGRKPGDENARELKRRRLESTVPQHGGGKLAYENGQVVGMAEYTSIEGSPFPIVGKDLLHLNCVWILPRFQKKGFGAELVKACIHEAQRRGKKGISVLAYNDPLFMPASFFQHEGFYNVGTRGNEELLWKDLDHGSSRPPRFVTTPYVPETNPRKLFVNVFYCAQCPWSIKTQKRIEKISREFPEAIVQSIKTDLRETLLQVGESKKVFVDGREVLLPTPTEDNIRTVLSQKIDERKLSLKEA